jgi:ABC-type glutathione transport system ATPase component
MPPRSRRKRNEETEQVAPIEATARAAKNLPVIKVVGISGSGKSTLVRALRAAGYDARPVSQEHSNVPDLWQQFDRPLYLIYLNASLEEQRSRRQDVSWSVAAHQQEVLRLTHAREHADVRINTAELTPEGVYRVASTYLARQHVPRANHPLEALPATGSAAKSPPPDSSA